MRLEDLEIYQLSIEIGEKVWDMVKDWKYFEKDTIGKQLVRSTDSVSANKRISSFMSCSRTLISK